MMQSIKDYCNSKSRNILQIAESLDIQRMLNDRELMNSHYCNLVKECVELTNKVKTIAINEGCEFGISKAFSEMISVDVSYIDSDIIKISFDNHLPLRTKGYMLNERDTIYKLYIKPLDQCFMNLGASKYQGKVVMSIIHTYAEGEMLIDHDNYEVKPIIDAINSLCLIDDSPKHVSYHIDYKIGEQSKTDIYLVPDEEFISFIGDMKRG